jgi:hypothetical protein
MPAPTTPTLILCQQLAAAVNTAWAPVAPSAADWDFWHRWADPDNVSVPAIQGRQILFVPGPYDWANSTRGRDDYTHHITCLVVERYTDAAGDVTRDWTSARVDFVHTYIVKGLRFTRSGPPSWNPYLMTLGATVEVCDVGKLFMGGKLFYAQIDLEFEELVS